MLEQPREVLGVDRRAVLADKDQVRVDPARPGQPLFPLALPTGSQHLHDPGVDTDGAARLVGLRLAFHHLVPHADTNCAHGESAGVEVDITPVQASHFPAAQATESENHPGARVVQVDRAD